MRLVFRPPRQYTAAPGMAGRRGAVAGGGRGRKRQERISNGNGQQVNLAVHNWSE